jgi:hypothetical protein
MWDRAGHPSLPLLFVMSEVNLLQFILGFYSPYLNKVLGIVCCVSYFVVLLRK